MIKVEALAYDLNGEGYPVGGMNFYWEPGSRVVLYQTWEHRASGPVWGQVTVDPMYSDNLATYVKECWSSFAIVDVTDDLC